MSMLSSFYIYAYININLQLKTKNELKKDIHHIKTFEVPGTELKTIKFNYILFITKTFH